MSIQELKEENKRINNAIDTLGSQKEDEEIVRLRKTVTTKTVAATEDKIIKILMKKIAENNKKIEEMENAIPIQKINIEYVHRDMSFDFNGSMILHGVAL